MASLRMFAGTLIRSVSQVELSDTKSVLTGGHVERGAAAKVGCKIFPGSKTKVGQFDRHTPIRDEDILWLKISMVDSNRMAKAYRIQNL